jgi:hypothetical protein
MRVGRALTIAVVLALGAFGLARPESVLVGGLAWLAFLMFALSGLGWFVARLARADDPDFGLRAVWGIAGYLATAGVLVMLDLCGRTAILGLVALGAATFAWREWTTPRPLSVAFRDAVAYVRAHPVVAYFAIAVALAAAVHVLGAVARLDRNPWDDDIAYTPFTKRLLDVGDMIEPFSFRRLAAYGGQTALHALAGARGTLANVHLIDQGLCFGLVMLLVVGYARELGRVGGLWLGLLGLVLVMLPDISLNTASYWSGAAVCLGMYRTVVRERLALAAVIGGAACTLRPTYMPVVVLFFALVLGFHMRLLAREAGWRDAWRRDRVAWARVFGIALAMLVPWCIAALRSSGTFLFPLVPGTWNRGLALAPSGWSWVDELSLLLRSCIASEPLVIAVIVVPLLAFVVDPRPRRPLVAWFVASVLGFGLLVHGFPAADTTSMWRYAFGYALPLFAVFVLEVDASAVELPVIGRWLLLAAILVQLATSRAGLVKAYAKSFRDVSEAAVIGGRGDPNARVERRRYEAMQAAVPAGARLVVMLDDPAFLDYSRNPIANLDTPGFASPWPQLPSFTSADALRGYLLDQGLRYVAFVRPERSRYFFRREFWVWRIFNDTEFFQAMSAYLIDASDSFVQLATSQTLLYDHDGLVVLDLGTVHSPAPVLDPTDEPVRRDAFVRALAATEHLEKEWSLSTRRDLAFEDGFSDLTFAPGDAAVHWYDYVVRDPEPTHGTPVRWMGRRAHLRVRGEQRMHLVLRGEVNLDLVFSRPRLDVSIDGELIASVPVDDTGKFSVDTDVAGPGAWADLYVVFDTIGEPSADVRELRAARLEEVTWQPR